jgi:hypothetical protein
MERGQQLEAHLLPILIDEMLGGDLFHQCA